MKEKIKTLKPNAVCPTCRGKVFKFEVIDPLNRKKSYGYKYLHLN